jgi:hypothetical protein
MGFRLEVFRIITDLSPVSADQPSRCAEPVLWRYRLGPTDSTTPPA